MEKKKKVKIPFDKIDITTATEDDIIRSGIKHNTSLDIICYFIMFGIVVLALVPVGLRIFMPKKATVMEKDIVYFSMTCYKSTTRDNYELNTSLVSDYRDGSVSKVVLEYNYFKRSEDAEEGYVFAEIHDLEQIKMDGLTLKKDESKATFTMDFENYPKLKEHETLKEYAKHSAIQLNSLINDKGFNCTTKSETKKEVVDIETGKKIK